MKDLSPYIIPIKPEDDRFNLARQYIEDNIYRNISVSELASYCCVSGKQLERIFEKENGSTVMEFIRKKRCSEIEKPI